MNKNCKIKYKFKKILSKTFIIIMNPGTRFWEPNNMRDISL